MKSGDKVKVIGNCSGHDMKIGTTLTIREIRPKQYEDKYETIIVYENDQCYFTKDLMVINTIQKPEPFIITDPMFIMNNKLFAQLFDKENLENSIQEITFPFKTIYHLTRKTDIIIHKIEQTPYGKGECSYGKYEIVTESKMLCIAENPYGWIDEPNGAAFKTLQEAENDFPAIIKKF